MFPLWRNLNACNWKWHLNLVWKKKNPTRYSVTAKVVPPVIHEIFKKSWLPSKTSHHFLFYIFIAVNILHHHSAICKNFSLQKTFPLLTTASARFIRLSTPFKIWSRLVAYWGCTGMLFLFGLLYMHYFIFPDFRTVGYIFPFPYSWNKNTWMFLYPLVIKLSMVRLHASIAGN